MTLDDLDYYSTEELINAVLRHTTFQGVIVHSRDEAKNPNWRGERVFAVRLNANLKTDEAGRLLDVVSRHLAVCE